MIFDRSGILENNLAVSKIWQNLDYFSRLTHARST